MNWRNLQANAFEACIAAMCMISGITTFLQPESLANSVVGRTLHPWDYLWTVMFMLSGVLILVGLSVPHRTLGRRFPIEAQGAELAGLIFLGTTLLINASAAIYVNGFTPGLAIYLAVIIACVYRGKVILSPAVELVPVEITSDQSISDGTATIVPPNASHELTDIPPDDYVPRKD